MDAAGNAHVTGYTSSINFTTTPGAFQPIPADPIGSQFANHTDAFVTKLNPAGSSLVYSTYLAGSGDDTGAGIAVDARGNAYVSGQTTSFDGGFLESLMGWSWSLETRAGWGKMMERYRSVLQNTKPPRIVGFNVQGSPSDYRFFRYAYASCLLDDGYFSFTDKSREYSSVPWFDEYDHKLGNALSKPPTAAWNQGVWRRDFQYGVVLVNPTTSAKTVKLEPGLRRLAGNQDRAVNNGSAIAQVTLEAKDGIVLRR